MADKELVNMIKSGRSRKADFQYANLRDANLERADLADADFRGADFYGADLSGADLSGADLSGADFYGADLTGADLRDADFTGADLRSARLTGSNLKGANFTGADLDSANLKIVTYDPQTKWPRGFTPPGEGRMASRSRTAAADKQLVNMIMSGDGVGANLRDADLSGAHLRGAILTDANLTGANLRGSDLQDADLTGANLRDADFVGANLTGAYAVEADFYSAILRDANFQGAFLDSADFRNANLDGAKFQRANLSNALLQGATLEGVKYDAKTIWPKGFTPPSDGSGRMASRNLVASGMSEELKIALSQLTESSNPLRSLASMVGAKNFTYSDKDENMYVQFNHMLGKSRRLPKSVGKTRLRYNMGNDTYTLTFLTSRGNMLAEVDDLHADELGEVWEEYTGLYLSFNAIRKPAY